MDCSLSWNYAVIEHFYRIDLADKQDRIRSAKHNGNT